MDQAGVPFRTVLGLKATDAKVGRPLWRTPSMLVCTTALLSFQLFRIRQSSRYPLTYGVVWCLLAGQRGLSAESDVARDIDCLLDSLPRVCHVRFRSRPYVAHAQTALAATTLPPSSVDGLRVDHCTEISERPLTFSLRAALPEIAVSVTYGLVLVGFGVFSEMPAVRVSMRSAQCMSTTPNAQRRSHFRSTHRMHAYFSRHAQ